MNLVDILARELKEWPAIFGCSIHQGIGGNLFTIQNGCLGIKFEKADDWLHAEVTRTQWQAAVDALKAAALNGQGLPPIGQEVHIHDPEGLLMYGAGESGEVIAHVENTAVVRMSYGLGCFTAKHLRTPEQIAADERNATIDESFRDERDLALFSVFWAARLFMVPTEVIESGDEEYCEKLIRSGAETLMVGGRRLRDAAEKDEKGKPVIPFDWHYRSARELAK